MHTTLAALERGLDNYPHGLVGMAEDLKKTKEVLRKEMDGGPSHKLGAVQAVYMAKLMCKAGNDYCYDFAAHVAEECGGKFVPGVVDDEETRSPIDKISHLMRETSDVTTTVLDSMSDNVISDNELMVIEREIAQAEDVLRKLRAAARSVHAASKPGGSRDFIGLSIRGMGGVAA